jgi:hypothetical protein
MGHCCSQYDAPTFSMVTVLNKHRAGACVDAIIGRGSKWRNPFRIGVDGDRTTVIAEYDRWLRSQQLLRA